MSANNKNFSKTELGAFTNLTEKGRVVVGESLGLTGAEISFNSFEPNVALPFVHSHKMNEEIYIIVNGNGEFMIDDDIIAVKEGDVLRIAPQGKRGIKAGDMGITYICIQAENNSLTQATENDGVMEDVKAPWME